MATRVCVVGSVNLDTVLTVDALPEPGQTVLATSMRSAPGGKGANQAVAAARAGARVSFVGAVGDDPAAERLRRHLRGNDVDIAGLGTVPGPSGSAVIAVDPAGENTIIVTPGANSAVSVVSPEVSAIITGCQVLLLQLEIPVAAATAAAEAARAAGAVVILNASPAGGDPAGLATLAGLTDVAVVNETESDAWVWPLQHRVITRGARGARYLGPDGTLDVPAPSVRAVDTSGAGDVFAGVLAAGWAAGHEQALRRACVAGALATRVSGAGDCAPRGDAIDAALLRSR